MTTLRTLLRAPLVSLTVTFTFAVATAILTIVFALTWHILVRQLPFPDADRLVFVWNRYGAKQAQSAMLSAPDFADYRGLRAFESAAAIQTGNATLMLGEPRRMSVARVTPDYFRVFGTARTFDDPGAVYLSEPLARSLFGGKPPATLIVDGKALRVAGVVPATFTIPRDVDLWLPLLLTAADVADANRGNESLTMVAKLRPGVSVSRAQAETDVVSRSVFHRVPGRVDFLRQSRWHVSIFGMRDDLVRRARPALLLLLAAALLVTLLAAANVLGLFLARTVARRKELAVRAALGAGRLWIAGALASEVLLLAIAGIAAGLLGARLAIPHIALTGLPRAAEVRIDATVAALAALLVLAAATLIGYGIAFWASRHDESLAERTSTGSAPATRMRAILVAAQVAIAVTLLTSGAMLLETYRRLRAVDLGFDPVNVLTFAAELPYPAMERRHAFFRELQDRLHALPGVVSVAAVSDLPFSPDDWTGTFTVEGFDGDTPAAHVRSILPEYPATMRIPVLRGRAFTRNDRLDSARVALVDEAAAKKYWPNQDPVGKRVRWGQTWREVVGVIGSVRTSSLAADAEPHLYFPLLQRSESRTFIVLRTSGDPAALANGVRTVVRELDPGQPVYAIRTMSDYLDDAIAQPRLRATVVAGAAGVSILLAVTGLYALLAYIVATRTREVGLRMALGATPAQMVRFIARWALRITAAGIVAGIAGAIVMTRAMRALLFGIDALDPATYAAVVAAFAIVAIAAGALPAIRAARVDPAIALRQE